MAKKESRRKITSKIVWMMRFTLKLWMRNMMTGIIRSLHKLTGRVNDRIESDINGVQVIEEEIGEE